MNEIAELLQQAKERDIAVYLRQDELVIRFPRETRPDQLFLERLRSNKSRLCEYFRESGISEADKVTIRKHAEPKLVHEGIKYYDIYPALVYWLDDTDVEFKNKLHGVLKFRLTGIFDQSLFGKAIGYTVARHETLRACFRGIDGRFYMSVSEQAEQANYIEYKDVRQDSDQGRWNDYSDFIGVEFDVEKGPLFLTRLLKTKDDEYILSFWMHHILFDGWSTEVMVKDIFTAYYSYLYGNEPGLPALQYHYKEYLDYLNRFSERHYQRDFEYWQRKFPPGLPKEMIIPGSKVTEGQYQVAGECKTYRQVIEGGSVKALNGLVARHSTTLAIVLQAILKLYLSRLTGANDILVATEVFGRDMLPEAEQQIGLYSMMRVIRTLFDGDEDIHEAIRKVKRSNEEMQEFVAFPLLDAICRSLPQGEGILGRTCKVTVNYNDVSGYFINNADGSAFSGKGLKVDYIGSEGDDVPIVWDFDVHYYNLKDKIDVVIIYRCDLYDEPVIRQITTGYLDLIEQIAGASIINH